MNSSTNSTTSGGMRTSPPLPPYISPGLTPSPNQWNSTGTFRPPPPFTLSDSIGSAGREGGEKRVQRPADVTKYKTEMCRNWEMSGTCSYRHCNFAHGVEELRKPLSAAPQPVAPPTISAVERVMDSICGEIRSERDSQFQQQESNRALEAKLRKTQQERTEEGRQLEALRAEIASLREAIAQRDEQLARRGDSILSNDVSMLLANLQTAKA